MKSFELSKIYRGCKKGGKPSLKKKWHVEYWGNGVRVKEYGGINYGKTINERETIAQRRKIQIDLKLMSVYTNPQLAPEPKEKKIKYPLKQCLDKSLSDKKRIIAEGSYKEYATPLKLFYEQTDILGLTDSDIRLITKKVFRDIIHSIVDTRSAEADKKGKPYNKAYNFRKYKANLLNLFQPWVDDEIIYRNPGDFTSPYKKPAPKLKIPLDNDQRKAIREKITKELPCFFPFCMMVMHTSMRPVEILRLRIKDINLKRREIYVYGEITKNRRGRIVHIPEVLVKYIELMNLESYPNTLFVFGQDWIPEERAQAMREDKANKAWRRLIKDPIKDGGLGIDSNLYHLKDLGMATKIEANISVEAIQKLAGHATINQSMTYMQPSMATEIKTKLAAEAKRKISEQMENLMKYATDF